MEVDGKDISLADKDAQPEAQKNHSLWSRIILALGFSTVGAKVGTIGMVADGASLLRDEPNKIRAIFNGTLKNKLIAEVMKHKPTNLVSSMKATAKVFKISLITTAIGMAVGGMLGWVRGDRVKHPKDLLWHPIKSLKLVLGPKPKETRATDAAVAMDEVTAVAQEGADKSTNWKDRSTQRQSTEAGRQA